MDTLKKRERYRRFWEPLTKGEGGYLAITSPVNDSGVMPFVLEPPRSLEEQWLSAEYCVKRAQAEAVNTYWGQDAIQSVFVNLGPGVLSAILGGSHTLHEKSIWFDMNPPIKDWNHLPVLQLNTEHVLYKAIESQTTSLCAASKGRYSVAFTDLGGVLDVLYSLRGEDLLSDFIEYPDEVMAMQTFLDDEFLACFQNLKDLIKPSGTGYSGWFPLISDEAWYPIQCDLSVMISTDMFEKFVLPSLDRISAEIGQSIYHLDGPGEVKHLDMILSLPHVHGIQWVPLPETKSDDPHYYFQNFADKLSLDIYRRTLDAGKKVTLFGVPPELVPVIFNEVGCDGVYIATRCTTRKEAEELGIYAQKNWLR